MSEEQAPAQPPAEASIITPTPAFLNASYEDGRVVLRKGEASLGVEKSEQMFALGVYLLRKGLLTALRKEAVPEDDKYKRPNTERVIDDYITKVAESMSSPSWGIEVGLALGELQLRQLHYDRADPLQL